MTKEVPKFKDLLWPTLRALEALGRSASIQEILERVASDLELSDEVLNVRHDDASSEFAYQCAWVRTYLKKVGTIDNSARGVWIITETGRGIRTEKEIQEKVRVWEKEESKRRNKKAKEGDSDADVSNDRNWEEELCGILLNLKADSFERLCQRILREAGFKKVKVTGHSGDGGIDGVGVLRVNLISFHVAFQCKRYKDSVGPERVRDFRGAIDGRADKGLLITTGFFTRGAEQEAVRPGAKAIDLIDGDGLCELLKDLGLGVDTESVEVVKLRPEFFEDF